MSIKFTLEATDKHMSLCPWRTSLGTASSTAYFNHAFYFNLDSRTSSICFYDGGPTGVRLANVLNVISVVFTVYQDMDIHRYGLVKQISWT